MHSYNELLKAYEELLAQYAMTTERLLAYETNFADSLSAEDAIEFDKQRIEFLQNVIDMCIKFELNSGTYQDHIKAIKRHLDDVKEGKPAIQEYEE